MSVLPHVSNYSSIFEPCHDILRPPYTHSSNAHAQPSSGARCLILFDPSPVPPMSVSLHNNLVVLLTTLCQLSCTQRM